MTNTILQMFNFSESFRVRVREAWKTKSLYVYSGLRNQRRRNWLRWNW
jgi:hypothetical protein